MFVGGLELSGLGVIVVAVAGEPPLGVWPPDTWAQRAGRLYPVMSSLCNSRALQGGLRKQKDKKMGCTNFFAQVMGVAGGVLFAAGAVSRFQGGTGTLATNSEEGSCVGWLLIFDGVFARIAAPGLGGEHECACFPLDCHHQ